MKKWIESLLFRFGFVPIEQVYAAVDAGEVELRRVTADKIATQFVAVMDANRAERVEAASTRGLNQRLATITARIPAVTR